MRHLHDCHIMFESVVVLRAKLIEKLGDQVPNTITFDVGFYDGQQHSKIWLCSNKDLEAMYRKHPTGEITLWCDGCTAADEDTTGRNKRKKDDSSGGPSKRQKKEEGVDSVFKELKESMATSLILPTSVYEPVWLPTTCMMIFRIPQTFCLTSKRSRQQSVSGAISGAAIALAKALGGTPKEGSEGNTTTPTALSSLQAGVSPGKAVELRLKNYKQLRYLLQLFDDGILSQIEYAEHKQNVLSSLRKL